MIKEGHKDVDGYTKDTSLSFFCYFYQHIICASEKLDRIKKRIYNHSNLTIYHFIMLKRCIALYIHDGD